MSLREQIGSTCDATAGRVGRVVNAAAQAIADGPETVGNQVQDGLERLAGARRTPLLPAGALRWSGGVASGAGDLAGALVVGLGSVIAGVLGGSLRLLGGILGGGGRLARSGLVDLGSGSLGAILVCAGKLVSLVQSILGAEARKRRLSPDEAGILKQVFRESLAIYDIRVIAGRSGVYRVTDRPFTLGNVIYMKDTGAGDWKHTLVHESTHIWQYQHLGSRYVTDALGAQFILGGNIAYDWQKALPRRWRDFNKEAQAQTVEDVYRFAGLVGLTPPGAGSFFDADGAGRVGSFVVPPTVPPDHMSDEDTYDLASLTAGDFTELAHEAVVTVRSVRAVRFSRRL
jgi:hypothetical protein